MKMKKKGIKDNEKNNEGNNVSNKEPKTTDNMKICTGGPMATILTARNVPPTGDIERQGGRIKLEGLCEHEDTRLEGVSTNYFKSNTRLGNPDLA